MSIIDCDVHPYAPEMESIIGYMPRAWRERFQGAKLENAGRAAGRAGRWMNPSGGLRADATPPSGGLPASDPAYVVKDLIEPHDIEAALLLPMQGCSVLGWTDPDAAAVLTAAVNDHMVEHWLGTDSRFKLCAVVSPHDPDKAAAEIDRHGSTRGVVGVMLPLLGLLMGDRHYHPIYAAAQEHGMPIVIHPTGAEGVYSGLPPFAGGMPRTYPGLHSVLPSLAHANLVSLVFDGVLERFPKLRVAMVEFGFSWIVPTLWRIDKEWQNFRYEVPWVKRAPSTYVRESVRFATQPLDEPQRRHDLWDLMEIGDASSLLMFSSDYPHYDADDPTMVIKHIPPAVQEHLHDNALDLFGARF